MDIPFHGTFDRETLYQAVLLASRPTRVQRILRMIIAVVFLAVLAGIALEITSQVNQGQVDSLRLVRGLVSLVLLGYVLARPLLLPRQLTTAMWNNPDLRVEQHGWINSTGLTYVSDGSQNDLGWEKYTRLYRRPDLVTLVTSDGRLTALPRLFFASDQDWDRFNQLAAGRVKAADGNT